MRDPFLSRDWADHHGELSAFLIGLCDQTRIAFERLAARTYYAPWKADTPCRLADDTAETPCTDLPRG